MNEISLKEIFRKQNPQDGKLPEWVEKFARQVCKELLDLVSQIDNPTKESIKDAIKILK